MTLTAAAVLAAALLATGCSADADDAAEPTPTAPTTSSAPSAPAPTTATPPAPTSAPPRPADQCLFTAEEIGSALEGTWTSAPDPDGCVYTSDRGAALSTSIVDQAIRPGLRDARRACFPDIEPITLSPTTFACLEDKGQAGRYVVGNTVRDDRLYIVVIPVAPEGVPEAELTAMTELMLAVA